MIQHTRDMLFFMVQRRRWVQRFTCAVFVLGTITSGLTAQVITVSDGEVSDFGSTTAEMLTVEAGGTLNLSTGANFDFVGAAPTTVNNAGVINTNPASDFQLVRGVTNSGDINISSFGSAAATNLEVQSAGATLTGGGTISLSGLNAGITAGVSGAGALTIGDQTVQGDGSLGRNTIAIINSADGLIDSNLDEGILLIDANTADGLTNAGAIQASNGGTLTINGTVVDNAGGTITAQAGSTVLLDNGVTINGGTVSSVGTGEVRTDTGSDVFLNGTTHSGSLISGVASDLGVSGTITNSGDINIDGGGSAASTNLEVQLAGATLTGGGTLTLSGLNAGVTGVAGADALTIGDQTIQGDGSLGRNAVDISIDAGATIDANVTDGLIVIDPAGASSVALINNGTLRASNGGTLDSVHAVQNNGTIDVDNGTFSALALSSEIGSVVSGDGDIVADVISISGLLAPGDDLSAGTLELSGSLNLDSDSTLEIDLFGLTEFDTVSVDSIVEALGTLEVSLSDDFTPNSTDVFDILTANPGFESDDFALGVNFANVASGERIFTTDGRGSFILETGGSVQLTNFEATAVPEPGSLTLGLSLIHI